MRAIRSRILAAIGTGSLAANGLSGCGASLTTQPDASGDGAANGTTSGDGTGFTTAADGTVPGVVTANSHSEGGGAVMGITDSSTVMDGLASQGDAIAAADAITQPETAADASGDGALSCTCSMLGGPCGDANPCGCCTNVGADCSGASTCVLPTVRRPFLVGASMRAAKSVARDDWTRDLRASAGAIDERTADALHRAWLDDGLQEHASVAAFARFTLQLLAVGAPPELVLASQRASLDEVAHARACFALARRYGGGCPVGPSPLAVHDALGQRSLVSLGELAAQEGCAGETLGATLAADQLAFAKDPEVVAILHKIAADELRHAELAWRFARWAVARGGEPVWRAIERSVRNAIEETRRIPMRDYGVDDAVWNAHGRLTCVQAHRAHERAIAEVVEPALSALQSVSCGLTGGRFPMSGSLPQLYTRADGQSDRA